MNEEVIVEPMTEAFVLWRCLHGGPLSANTIDQCPSERAISGYRHRNTTLLRKLAKAYGACAILARDGQKIVGHLRFYPKVVWELKKAGELCLQQDYPWGPADDFAEDELPSLEHIKDKTLVVHCLMTGSPQQTVNPYQRKGLGTRLVKTLIGWARTHGWERLEAKAFEDLPIIYEITGSAGVTFWKNLEFTLVERTAHPELQKPSEFLVMLEEQAKAAGIAVERAKEQLLMRLDLL